MSGTADRNVKIFNFEKQKRRKHPIRRKAPENLLKRARGLKTCMDLKYENFLPLYTLWKSYFKELLQLMNNKPDHRLLKADYHGALLRISDSPNKTQIDLYGIVLHESKFTFQMITKQNRVIVIPKEATTFQFVLDNKLFTLFGSAICQRSYLRGRKAKVPTTIPCFLI